MIWCFMILWNTFHLSSYVFFPSKNIGKSLGFFGANCIYAMYGQCKVYTGACSGICSEGAQLFFIPDMAQHPLGPEFYDI